MDAELFKLVQRLADGRFYSGEKLAALFGVTRSAIWKRVQRIDAELQIGIDRVRGRGYRLSRPLVLLDTAKIMSALDSEQTDCLESLHLLATIESTNDFVAQQYGFGKRGCIACLAEQQTAGRGRRGRSWVSVFGQNIYLSLGYTFRLPLGKLSGMSIAAGVRVAQVLREHGLQQHSLKWPNDIHCSGKKLAGILVDASGDMEGPARAVIGIGLNMHLDQDAASGIDQPWTDLSREMTELPDRNQLAGNILSALIEACQTYESKGLKPFLPAWRKFDQNQGYMVDLYQGNEVFCGRYVGLSEDGGLTLERLGGRKTFYAGEISMRAKAEE